MCRVAGCKDNHSVHYCKVCQQSDVDHFSSQCKQAFSYNGGYKQRCRAPGCP